MKRLSRQQLRRLIIAEAEHAADINQETIDKTVLEVLEKEGGAAGLKPLQDALEALEVDGKKLPAYENIEDLILKVPGVFKHIDTDFYTHEPADKNESKQITKQNLRLIIREILSEGKDTEVPAHFGSGKDIDVFGYKTKHFDICLSATNLFNDLKKQLNTKGVDLDGIEKMVKKAARISDQIFGLEKRVVKRGTATKQECDRARELNVQLKDCLKHVLGGDTNKKLSYMPMHIREITKRKEK